MLDVVLFLHTVMDTHYCGGLVCLLWWAIMLDVVVYYSMLGVVVLFADCVDNYA